MLTNGEALLTSYHKNWPNTLPVRVTNVRYTVPLYEYTYYIQVLIVHGTADKVTSHKASQEFIDMISAAHKKISLFEGGFHELQNEPNGVKEKLADEVLRFIESHLPPTISVTEAEPVSETPSVTETTSAEGQTQAKL
jgi:acylglycerol lipase